MTGELLWRLVNDEQGKALVADDPEGTSYRLVQDATGFTLFRDDEVIGGRGEFSSLTDACEAAEEDLKRLQAI